MCADGRVAEHFWRGVGETRKARARGVEIVRYTRRGRVCEPRAPDQLHRGGLPLFGMPKCDADCTAAGALKQGVQSPLAAGLHFHAVDAQHQVPSAHPGPVGGTPGRHPVHPRMQQRSASPAPRCLSCRADEQAGRVERMNV